jgi:hypothetical protein
MSFLHDDLTCMATTHTVCQLFPNIAGATADRPGADVCQPCRGDFGGKRRGICGIGGAYEARLYVDVLLFNHDYDCNYFF